jgi:hypothetical protein
MRTPFCPYSAKYKADKKENAPYSQGQISLYQINAPPIKVNKGGTDGY